MWATYTDHASWTRWAGIGRVTLEPPGSPDPNGVGCVRVIRSAGVAAYEEVVEFEAPRRMAYRLVRGGLPIHNHLGEVRFEEEEGGTRVRWRCQFDSKLPGLGGVCGLIAGTVFKRVLAGLDRTLRSGA